MTKIETSNYMKLKGRFYMFVTQPLLFSGVSTIILVGSKILFLWLDYGSRDTKIIVVEGITTGWHVILFIFIGLSIVLSLLNIMRWIYYTRK